MGNSIRVGDSCILTRDIVVDGVVAFSKSATVMVEKIDPSPQKPEYKYVVLSPSLQRRFRLSDRELQRKSTDTLLATPVASIKPGAESIEPGSSGLGSKIAIGIVALVLLGAAGIGIWFVVRGLSSPSLSFSVDKNATGPAVVGRYTDTTGANYVWALQINSDGTYFLTRTPTGNNSQFEEDESFSGVWSKATGGTGTWHTTDVVRAQGDASDSYELIGRITTRSTDPDDASKSVDRDEFWYVTENGDITDGVNLYEKR